MKINNINTLNHSATLLERTIENAEIINYDDWLDDAFSPIFHKQVFKYIYIVCIFFIDKLTDDVAEEVISDMIMDSSSAELIFDDMQRMFKGLLTEYNKEKIAVGKYELTLKWKCQYAYESEITETANQTLNKVIVNVGNICSPAIVEIIPTINLIDFNVNGFGEEFLIKNLTAGKKIIINSEDGTVMEDGLNKFHDFEGWGFPVLYSGENTITFSTTNADINIKYKPRWI